MRFFPAVLSPAESASLADAIEAHFEARGFGLWAVEVPGVAPFAGFVGLNVPTFTAPCTPCVEIGWRLAAAYAAVQVLGAVAGVFAAHAMFAEPILQVSTRLRDGPAQAFAEFVATFGLLATILGTLRFRPDFTPSAVGLYITAAYWFTAATYIANTAVTVARSLSDTIAGNAPSSASDP